MTHYIKELEKCGTCTIVSRKSVTDAHIIPSTWDFNVKCFSSGRSHTFKSRLCARDDRQLDKLYYFGNYALVISWTTVILMIRLSINQCWATRQVDFSCDFFRSSLVEDVYISLPYYFYSDPYWDISKMVMKLIQGLYGLVRSPLYWYNRVKGGFEDRGFKPIPLNSCMFYIRVIITLIYVYDVLFFGTD